MLITSRRKTISGHYVRVDVNEYNQARYTGRPFIRTYTPGGFAQSIEHGGAVMVAVNTIAPQDI